MAQRQALIASKATGRLEALYVKVGDAVKANQVIARLEHADMDALLQQMTAKVQVARAQVGTAKPELQEAGLHFERVRTLFAKSFVTQSEYDMAGARFRRAAAAVKSAEAAVGAAEAEKRAAEVQLENTNIRAPFDGIVVKKLAEVGEVVSPMTATMRSGGAVVTIFDPTSVMVDAEVSEAVIQRVQAGQSVEIQLDSVPGHRYRGEVTQVMPIADRAKGTVLTRVRFLELDERVRGELSAKVTFGPRPGDPHAGRELWLVPTTAIVSREGRPTVWVVQDGHPAGRAVEVLGTVGPQTTVAGSLAEGLDVVTTPGRDRHDGSAVTSTRRAQ